MVEVSSPSLVVVGVLLQLLVFNSKSGFIQTRHRKKMEIEDLIDLLFVALKH